MTSILSDNQSRILDALSHEKSITDTFYFGGGTVLAEYYLHHRYSEDLDFFSVEEFDPFAMTTVFQKIKSATGITGTRYEQSFNRNLFFLDMSGDTIKTEFTYFPFPQIDASKRAGDLRVDSLIDIAVNKVFTIYQKPRSRDFIDLYSIMRQQKEWTLRELSQKAQVKFDTYIEPIQFGAQLIQAQTLKDYPRMLTPLDPHEWIDFFIAESKRLRSEVLE